METHLWVCRWGYNQLCSTEKGWPTLKCEAPFYGLHDKKVQWFISEHNNLSLSLLSDCRDNATSYLPCLLHHGIFHVSNSFSPFLYKLLFSGFCYFHGKNNQYNVCSHIVVLIFFSCFKKIYRLNHFLLKIETSMRVERCISLWV